MTVPASPEVRRQTVTALTTDEKRKVLADLAGLVSADRRCNRPTYTDAVLAKMLPAFCHEDLTPAVCVALFDELVAEASEVTRFDANWREIDVAESNVEHYITALVFGAAEASVAS